MCLALKGYWFLLPGDRGCEETFDGITSSCFVLFLIHVRNVGRKKNKNLTSLTDFQRITNKDPTNDKNCGYIGFLKKKNNKVTKL